MSNTTQAAVETAAAASAAKVAQTATYAGSGAAVFFGLTANELAAVGGLILGFVGLVANTAITVYFKSRHLKLAEQQARAGDDRVRPLRIASIPEVGAACPERRDPQQHVGAACAW